MIRAAVFDMDDTLYPERSFALSGLEAVARRFEDILGPREEVFQRMRVLFESDRRRSIFNELLGAEASDELVQAMIDHYRAHRPLLTLHPDARRALERLRGRFKLGLISDGPLDMQRNKVEALNLRSWFDVILLTEELGPGYRKPHPRAFERMAERLGVKPSECVYVADNVGKDFVAPNALGWLTVRILREDGLYRDAPIAVGGAPRHTRSSLDNVLDVIMNETEPGA